MPKYRFMLPVRAIGTYRLPEGGLSAEGVAVTPATPPAYTARVDSVQADSATVAYALAQQRVEQFFSYLALLGDDAAFVLDGTEGLRGRNLDLQENPPPVDQPPPPFESVGGVMTEAGQKHFAALLDPNGEKRRSGVLLVHDAQYTVVPGQDRLTLLCDLFKSRETAPQRVRTALSIIHDAACTREPSNGFAQSFTALEVLTEHLRPSTVLDVFYRNAGDKGDLRSLPYQAKASLLEGLRQFLRDASLSTDEADRIVSYASTAQSVSQIDVFFDYLAGLGLAVTRAQLGEWRKLRGKLVHAAQGDPLEMASMQRFRETVRWAVLEELKRAGAVA